VHFVLELKTERGQHIGSQLIERENRPRNEGIFALALLSSAEVNNIIQSTHSTALRWRFLDGNTTEVIGTPGNTQVLASMGLDELRQHLLSQQPLMEFYRNLTHDVNTRTRIERYSSDDNRPAVTSFYDYLKGDLTIPSGQKESVAARRRVTQGLIWVTRILATEQNTANIWGQAIASLQLSYFPLPAGGDSLLQALIESPHSPGRGRHPVESNLTEYTDLLDGKKFDEVQQRFGQIDNHVDRCTSCVEKIVGSPEGNAASKNHPSEDFMRSILEQVLKSKDAKTSQDLWAQIPHLQDGCIECLEKVGEIKLELRPPIVITKKPDTFPYERFDELTISNELDYRIKKAEADDLRSAIADLVTGGDSEELQRLRVQFDAIDKQLGLYDELGSGKLPLIDVRTPSERVAERLIRRRHIMGLNQRQLAEKMGLHEQQIQRYEATGYRSASLKRILEVVDALQPEDS